MMDASEVDDVDPSTMRHVPEVAGALQEAADADAMAAEIEQRIVAGDATLGLDDLEAAERQGRFARLRARAAAGKAARDAERKRLARIEEWRALIRDNFGAHEGSIIDAFDAAVEANAALVAAIQAHNDGRRAIVNGLDECKPLPDDLHVDRDRGFLRLTRLDVQIDDVDAQALAAEAAWRAFAAVGADREASQLRAVAGVGVDRHTSSVLGIPNRADGAPTPHARSDWIRYIARRVVERDGR